MAKTKSGMKPLLKARESGSTRASVSFPRNIYGSLEEIARRKKVSLAWVVRDAAEKYVAEDANDGKTERRSSGTARKSERLRSS
jgi:metal-responsive CopG/Arc/MetJ family transcriptional regulator